MKKNYIYVGILSVLLIIFTGCGDSSSENKTDEEVYNMKIGHVVDMEHPIHKGVEKFKELVEEKSNDRVKIEIYPNSQLGGQNELNEGTQNGTITANSSGFASIGGNFDANYNTLSLPFLVTPESLDDAFAMMNGEIGEELISSLEESGLTSLGFSSLGFRHLTNNVREVKSPEDLEGLKIRLQPNPIHINTFKTLGAEPVSLDFSEVYTGLQQGVIDGQENPADIIATNNLYEVQKYFTSTGHFFDFNAIWVNKEFFDGLPEELQSVLQESGQEAADFQTELYLNEEEDHLNKLKEEGMEIYELTPEESQKFQDASKPVYKEYLEDAKDRDLAERILTELEVEY